MIKKLLLSLVLCYAVYGQPTISTITGIADNDSSLVIEGTGFGTKGTAAPIIWDDCSGSDITVLWDGAWPEAAEQPTSTPVYTTSIRSVPMPHSHSTQYIAGRAPGTGLGYPNNVMVWKNRTVSLPCYTYMSWYQCVDPLFNSGDNFKWSNYSCGTSPYTMDSPTNSNWFVQYYGGLDGVFIVSDDGATIWNQPPNYTIDYLGNSKYFGESTSIIGNWVKIELAIYYTASTGGWFDIWENGNLIKSGSAAHSYNGPTDAYDGTSRTEAVGGFSRLGGSNNYRYFSDIYLDYTLQRVVICSTATWNSGGRIETQIPTAWSDESITVTVNQGIFGDGDTAHLFVVNAAGVPSAGEMIIFGAGEAGSDTTYNDSMLIAQISTENDFSDTVFIDTTTGTTIQVSPFLTPSTKYYWRAWGANGLYTSEPSAADSFTTEGAIEFHGTGSTFSAILQTSPGADVLWIFADGDTMQRLQPVRDFGSATARTTYLKVTPWSALKTINIGYDGADGGSDTIDLLEQQNITSIVGLDSVSDSLGVFCASHNPLTSISFNGFSQLNTVEMYQCQSVTSVNLTGTTALSRLCLEDCNIAGTLDVSSCTAMADFRGALNDYDSVAIGGTRPTVWHWCMRDNPQITRNMDATVFPNLEELYILNCAQGGVLHVNSPSMHYLYGETNSYTYANLPGCFIGAPDSLTLHGNDLTGANIDGNTGLTYITLRDNNITRDSVTAILVEINSWGTSSGFLSIQNNAVPLIAGRSAVTSLRSRGWTVQYDSVITDPTLTVTDDGNGSTSPAGAVAVDSARAMAISATADGGYNFVNWTVTAGSATFGNANLATTTVTINASATIRANFDTDTFTLSISVVGTGTVDTLPRGKEGMFQALELCTLIAVYAPPDTIVTWSGASPAHADTVILTMDRNRSVTATFSVQISVSGVRRRGWGGFTPAFSHGWR